MIWFTSDLHINHNKDFIYKERGFSNIYEHNTAILKNWNSLISYNDTVYILGDLCLGNDEMEWNRIFYNLNGNKYFIIGNHDTDNKIKKYINDYNMDCLGYSNIFKYNKKYRFYLSHYPTIISNFDDNKKIPIINLCGHSHTKNKFIDIDKGFIYHVELDAHNIMPINIEQIIKDIKNIRKEG